MRIKRVVISGFKSYKEQVVFDEFAPGVNVIVGRNGSGKSNFFDAIRFVLGDDDILLSQDARHRIFHDTSGTTSDRAVVELYLDNTDRKIPIEKDEIIIRRELNQKESTYHVDNKHIQKSDFTAILDSAGISLSSFFNIVPQGTVAEVATMTPEARLKLCKDVSGATTYEEKDAKAEKILQGDAKRMEDITDTAKQLEQRMEELRLESNELQEYKQTESRRNVIEASLVEQGIADTRALLDDNDNERATVNDAISTAYARLHAEEETLSQDKDRLRSINSTINSEQDELTFASQQRMETMARIAKLEFEVGEARDQVASNEEQHHRIADEISRLEKERTQTEEEIAKHAEELTRLREREATLQSQKSQAEHKQKLLLRKQTREQRFRTVEERNAWIDKTRAELKQEKDRNTQQMASAQGAVDILQKQLKKLQTDIKTKEEEIAEANKDAARSSDAALEQLDLEQEKAVSKQKDLWQQENTLVLAIEGLADEMQRADRTIISRQTKDIMTGLTFVRKVMAEEREQRKQRRLHPDSTSSSTSAEAPNQEFSRRKRSKGGRSGSSRSTEDEAPVVLGSSSAPSSLSSNPSADDEDNNLPEDEVEDPEDWLAADDATEDRIYGPVIDLIDTDDANRIAAEVIAGPSLFYIVCSNERCVAKLLRRMKTESDGRLTFIPLTHLRRTARPLDVPSDIRAEDAVLASKCVHIRTPAVPTTSSSSSSSDPSSQYTDAKTKYINRMQPIIDSLFGRTLIAKDLSTASQIARLHHIDCCTREGMQANKKGALSGGYFDPQRSILGARAKQMQYRESRTRAIERLTSIRQQIDQVKEQTAALLQQSQDLRRARVEQQQKKDRLSLEFQQLSVDRDVTEARLRNAEKECADLRTALTELEARDLSLSAERDSTTLGILSPEEQSEVAELTKLLPQLREEEANLEVQRDDAESAQSLLSLRLKTRILPRLSSLRDQLSSSSSSSADDDQSPAKERLAILERELKELKLTETKQIERIAQLQTSIDAASKESNELLLKVDTAQGEVERLRWSIAEEAAKDERLLTTRASLWAKNEQYLQRQRDLNVSPAETANLQTISKEERYRMLHEAQQKLRTFAKVNRKAMELHENMEKQQADLAAKQKELADSLSSLRKLRRRLQKKKKEALHTTLETIAYHFSHIFAELVEGGKAELTLQRKVKDSTSSTTSASKSKSKSKAKAKPKRTSKALADSTQADPEANEESEEESQSESDSVAEEVIRAQITERSAAIIKKNSERRKKMTARKRRQMEGDETEDESSEEEDEDEKPSVASQKSKAKKGKTSKAGSSQDEDDESDDDEEDDDDLVGVSFRVSFTKGQKVKSIDQLSGGQKTFAAITLIFAIQRTDPAPFYLFDETDAMLDAPYRHRFASLIRRLSDGVVDSSESDSTSSSESETGTPTQFFLTTFSPQLIEVADKFFGVEISNKLSRIRSITQQDALQFVESSAAQRSAPHIGTDISSLEPDILNELGLVEDEEAEEPSDGSDDDAPAPSSSSRTATRRSSRRRQE